MCEDFEKLKDLSEMLKPSKEEEDLMTRLVEQWRIDQDTIHLEENVAKYSEYLLEKVGKTAYRMVDVTKKKKKLYDVRSGSIKVGEARYNEAQQQYCFYPTSCSVLDSVFLKDVARLLEDLNKGYTNEE